MYLARNSEPASTITKVPFILLSAFVDGSDKSHQVSRRAMFADNNKRGRFR